MYRELLPEDHRRILDISAEEVPDVLLLLGVFDVYEGAARFARYLEDAHYLRDGRKGLPAWLGKSHGLKVALAASFGGPMAATHAHTWLAAGTPVVVQIGWYGALQHGSSLGDVSVPRHAERQDGVSDWYLPKGILADSTPELSASIAANLRAAGVGVNEHGIYSTPALLAESREVIADWSRHGYHGVDMETAATFAVAKSLGAQRAAALIRFDDLVNEEHSLAEELKPEHLGVLRQREPVVVEAVLAAVASLKMPGT